MNTETTGQQAEVATETSIADEVLHPLERIIWCAEHGERPNRGEFKDAEESIVALRKLLAAAGPFRGEDSSAGVDLDDALDACRAVGGAR